MATLDEIGTALERADAAGNVDDARELAKYYSEMKAQQAQQTQEDSSEFGNTARSTGAHMVNAFLGQPVEDIGTAIGSENVAEFGKSVRERAQQIQKENPSSIGSLKDIGEHPVDTLEAAAGNVLPQLPVSLASSWAGAEAGAALGSVVPGAGTAIGAVIGGALGLFAPSYMQEYTEMRGKQHEGGKEDIPKALLTAIPAAALDAIADKILLGGSKLLPSSLRSAVGAEIRETGAALMEGAAPIKGGALDTALKIVKQGGIGAAVEGPTEYVQTGLEQIGGNQDVSTPEAANEREVSAALGAVGGAGIKSISAFLPGANPEQPAQPEAEQPAQPGAEQPAQPEAEQPAQPQPGTQDTAVDIQNGVENSGVSAEPNADGTPTLYDELTKPERYASHESLDALDTYKKSTPLPNTFDDAAWNEHIAKQRERLGAKEETAQPEQEEQEEQPAEQTAEPKPSIATSDENTAHTIETLTPYFTPQMRALVKSGKLTLHDSLDTFPGENHPEGVQGLTTPQGEVHLLANKLTPESMPRVALHEMGVHVGMKGMVGDKVWGDLTSQALTTKGGAFEAARRSVPEDTPEHLKGEETLAYLVENAPHLPIVKRTVAAIKNWARTTFGARLSITEADIHHLATKALRKESLTSARSVREGTAYAQKPISQKQLDAINAVGQRDLIGEFDTEREGITSDATSTTTKPALVGDRSAANTQIDTTMGAYAAVARNLFAKIPNLKNILDYGAGKGRGTASVSRALKSKSVDANVRSYEPFPENWAKSLTEEPDYTSADNIKDGSQDAVVNLNVLNVVPRAIRDNIIENIGRVLKDGGIGVISSRRWKGDVDTIKPANSRAGEEPNSFYVTRKLKGETQTNYQKGIEPDELVAYVQELLPTFDVRKINGYGASAVIIQKPNGTPLLDSILKSEKTQSKGTGSESTLELRKEAKDLGAGERYSAFGVGKKMGDEVYLHRDYEGVLPQGDLADAKERIGSFEYNLIRYNAKTGAVGFFNSPDFDTSPEPVNGVLVVVEPDGTIRNVPLNKDLDKQAIYHHKWQWVKDDYAGFDVAQSIERSIKWQKVVNREGINRKRIGFQGVWQNEVIKPFDIRYSIANKLKAQVELDKKNVPTAKESWTVSKKPMMSNLTRAIDIFEQQYMSHDAVLVNSLRRYLEKIGAATEYTLTALTRSNQMQTVNVTSVAAEFTMVGGGDFDSMGIWSSIDSKDNLVSLRQLVDDGGAKQGWTQRETHAYFTNYMVSKRILELFEEAKNHEATANATVDKDEKAVWLEKAKEIRAILKRDGANKAKSQATADAYGSIEGFVKAEKMWHAVRVNLIKTLVKSGLFSQEKADAYVKALAYVPFNRVMENLTDTDSLDSFIEGMGDNNVGGHRVSALTNGMSNKKLKGSERDVMDIMSNMEAWSQISFTSAIRAKKATDLIDVMRKSMPVGTVTRVHGSQSAEDKAKTVVIYSHGKKQSWMFEDVLMASAFRGTPSAALIVPLLTVSGNIMRSGIVLAPTFTIGQLPQDIYSAFFTAGIKNPFKLAYDLATEFGTTAFSKKDTDTHQILKRMGAVGVKDNIADSKSTHIHDISFHTHYDDEAKTVTAKAWRGLKTKLEKFAMAGDNAIRQAVYKRSMEELKGNPNAKAIATQRAFDVINFRRRGASAVLEQWRSNVPFMGATIQAQRAAFQVIAGRGLAHQDKAEVYKRLVSSSLTMMAMALVHNVLYGSLLDDDEFKKKSNRDKDSRIFLLGGNSPVSLAIRPDIWSMPFVGGNHLYQALVGREDAAQTRDALLHTLFMASGLGAPMTPPLLKEIAQYGANYDFFTERPIVPERLQRRATAEQYDTSTSELGKIAGKVGMSPIKFDHIVSSLFSGTGKLVLVASNVASFASNVSVKDHSLRELVRMIPGTSSIVPVGDSFEATNLSYKVRREVETANNTYNSLVKDKLPAEAKAYKLEHKALLNPALITATNLTTKTVDDLHAQLRQIHNSKNLNAAQKKVKEDLINKKVQVAHERYSKWYHKLPM